MRTIQRIWEKHRLQPHRIRTFKRSIANLEAAINRYLKAHNDDPKPFVWTRPGDAILAKLNRPPVPSV